MNSNDTSPANELDCIRRVRGSRACRNTFHRLVLGRRETAVKLINDESLVFTTLFILRPVIEETNLYDQLCDRNLIALDLCERIVQNKLPGSGKAAPYSLDDEGVHLVLLWMFQTGRADDGLSEEFDQILDIAASILIKTHHEKMILPQVADLLFLRNRGGKYVHDLAWAYMQSREPDALRHIAKRLISQSRSDNELAAELLHMNTDDLKSARGRQKKYTEFSEWLKENDSYLYFTGESFQLTNNPVVCDVDLEAKYLSKKISPRNRKPIDPLTEEENGSLKQFKDTQDEDKTALAKYSHKLHDEDPDNWSKWMHMPVMEQVRTAREGRRELV